MSVSAKEMKALILAMTPEQKAANLSALNYVKTLAAQQNMNISEWNILEIFGKEDGVNLVTDKKNLNKLFFDKLLKVKEEAKAEALKPEVIQNQALEVEKIKKAFVEAAKKIRANEIQVFRNNLYTFEQNLARAQQNLNSALVQFNETNNKIRALEEVTDVDTKYTSALAGVQKVIEKGLWINPVYENGYLYLNTQTNVMLHEVNKAAKLDLHLDLGQLAVRININSNMHFDVIPYKNNLGVQGYFHPHVRPEGGICWGEASTAAMKHIADLQLEKALILLHSLINSYNPASPYMPLSRFKAEGNKMTRVAESVKHPDKNKKPKEETVPVAAPTSMPPAATLANDLQVQANGDLRITF